MKTSFLALVSSVAFVACASSRTFDENLQLPRSTAEQSAPPGLAVTVTKKAILVEGNAVVALAAGKVDPKLKGEGGYSIMPLIEALEKRAAPVREAAKRAGKPFDAHVTLSFDGALSYRMFTEVIYSCGQAGYSRYDLIVRKATDGSLGAIPFTIPDVSSAQQTPEPTVLVTLKAFKIAIDGEQSDVPKLANGRYDYESLRTRLSELKASAGDAENGVANLAAHESVPYEVVVATLDAMRVTHDRRPLFPDIHFAAGVEPE